MPFPIPPKPADIPLTREDRRSMALHRGAAEELLANPEPVLALARRNLDRFEAMHPHAGHLFRLWREWLELPLHELAERMAGAEDEVARDMRQVTPFAGLLSADRRRRILNQFRRSGP